MTIARSDLLNLIYRFYPRKMLHIPRSYVPLGELSYLDTDEHRRLEEASARGRADCPTWNAMINRLWPRYDLQNESLRILAGGTEPAYSARIWLTDKTAMSLHVSLLGPYYGIHLPGLPQEEPVAREVIREIESTYPGYQRIPPEVGDVVVPDLFEPSAYFGVATIYVCLFSTAWTLVAPA